MINKSRIRAMESKKYPDHMVFGLDIGTRSIVGTIGYKQSENEFIVVAQTVRFHETRAMMDGQIHDIGRVAGTIAEVKSDLEKQIGRKLSDVCIAAAGRVLKTVTVHADFDLGSELIIADEHIHSLELAAVEKAYVAIGDEQGKDIDFYCVGYTVVNYYLNGNMITNLESHKGTLISADVLATFLPNEVVDGLYAAVEKAGLKVENLTLEPIAAINIAIPEKFRLLNIALVDVGAGTSDICITKGGSISAYGMIPRAGDEITEVIVQNHLVEFSMAEQIKIGATGKSRAIHYTDIIGLPGKITSAAVLKETAGIVKSITEEIAKCIIELNGGKSVSAVFIVGGGGKFPTFAKFLAEHLKILPERVALRGEEVLGAVRFLQPEIKKDPLLVTPIGICLNYYEKKNNFIFVQVNGERVKLYDNGKLTVVDAALSIGFQNEKLFPRRGKTINFTINGAKRMVRGEPGEPAQIILNGKHVSIAATIMQNDIIEIRESTIGADAVYEVGQLPEYASKSIDFMVNGKKIKCPRFILANGELVSEFYSIKDLDNLRLSDYYTLKQVFDFIDILPKGRILVNNKEASMEDKVYENFSITFDLEPISLIKKQTEEASALTKEIDNVPIPNKPIEKFDSEHSDLPLKAINLDGDLSLNELNSGDVGQLSKEFDSEVLEYKEYSFKDLELDESYMKEYKSKKVKKLKEDKEPVKELPITIKVFVNHTAVVLKGKSKYVLVDILDVYPFDVKTAHGRNVIITLNGEKADFSSKIKEADIIELYWVY